MGGAANPAEPALDFLLSPKATASGNHASSSAGAGLRSSSMK